MKNILLLTRDDDGQEARFQAATDLVRALNGHLLCLDLEQMPLVLPEFYGSTGEAMLIAQARTQGAENRERIEARLRGDSLSWEWIEGSGTLRDCLTQQAALADLVVASGKLDQFPWSDMREIAAEVLIDAKKPMLAVPQDCRRLDVCGRVLVAWDGSRQASAALRAAQPLLALAAEVILLELDDGSVTMPAEEAAAWLSRHGIEPQIRRRRNFQDSVAAEIAGTCAEAHIAYVVMGGYGHRPAIEALFGGVTRAMLTHGSTPLLLAH